MIRAARNISLKERLTYTFDKFRGVDFSTTPFKVSNSRATKAQNLIFKDGVVRKRTGWEMLWKFDERVNGLFNFELNDEKVILAYVGTTFYKLWQDEITKKYMQEEILLPENVLPLKDQRIQVYVNNNKAYIVGCGDYLVYGKYDGNYELRRVYNDSATYIPTTTINIDHDGSIVPKRQKIVGVDEPSFTLQLDSAIKDASTIKITVNTLNAENKIDSVLINNRLVDKTKLYLSDNDLIEVGSVNFKRGKIVLNLNTKPENDDVPNIIVDYYSIHNDTVRGVIDDVNLLTPYRINKLLGVDEASATWTLDGEIDDDSKVDITLNTIDKNDDFYSVHISNRLGNKNELYYDGDDITQVGSVDFANGKITLNINTKPQSVDDSNIIVTFASTLEDKFISNASTSIVFGTNGNSDRLFISGYKGQKNMHRWSEPYDFTYFPDTNYDVLGSDSSAIVGYVRATDGTLLVFKEDKGIDATLYYITGQDVTKQDYNGDNIFVGEFYKKAGFIADTMLTPYAYASLNGDNLVLTKNGVRGLSLQENITIENYRLQERSRTINAKLLKESDLKSACAFVFDDKYYLSVNGVVYVADSKFTFASEEDIGSSFNYEWQYWTNIDARVFCEIDGVLYFGGNNGKICKFSENDFADISYQTLESGEVAIDFGKNRINYFKQLDESLKNGDTIRFTDGDIYASYIDNHLEHCLLDLDAEKRITFDESLINKIYDGVELFADKVVDSGLLIEHKYTIGDCNLGDLTFRLYDENDQVVQLTSLNFRLSKKVDKKELYITNLNSECFDFQVKEYVQGEILKLIAYDNVIPAVIKARLTFRENIRAEWYTPVYDLGSNMYAKTLVNFTISTEPLVKNSIIAGYQTRNMTSEFIAKGVKSFDFNDFDFEDFSFESDFGSSFTKKVKERNFNFIMLRYISDNQNACAVNSMTIRYKVNKLNKGVR